MAKHIYNFTEKTVLDLTDEFVLQETGDGAYKKTLFSTVYNTLLAQLQAGLSLTIGSSLKQELTYIPISSTFPWWCLNQPNTTILNASVPDLASAMRNYKLRMKPWSDNISTWDVTDHVETGSSATLTFKKNANLSGTVTASDSDTLLFSVAPSLTVGDILILGTGAIVRAVSMTDATHWRMDQKVTITAGTARIATMEELMIRALYYAQEVHGSYTDWFCLTLTSAIGNISAGDYLISGLSVASNTITIVTSATAGSGSGTFNDLVEIYPFRIPSSTNARHYSWAGHNMVAAGGDEHTLVAGLMRLDYMQGWQLGAAISGVIYYAGNAQANSAHASVTSASRMTWDAGSSYQGATTKITAYSDGTNGAPRTGKRTHGADASVYTYIYAGQVN